MSAVETELMTATALKAKRGEDRQGFLTRLVEAIDELKDKDFKKLSEEGQEWFKNAGEAYEAKGDIPDFANGEDTGTTEEEEVEATPTKRGKGRANGVAEEAAPKKGTKKAAAPKAKAEPEKPKGKLVQAAKPVEKQGGAYKYFIEQFVEDPTRSVDQLLELVGKKNMSMTKQAASTVRSHIRRAILAMQEAGHTKRKLISE